MTIPSNMMIDLSIQYCTDLPKVSHELLENPRSSRSQAEAEHESAITQLQNALQYAASAPREIFDHASNHVELCMRREQDARNKLESSTPSISFSRTRPPNPFVVVSLDEDHATDSPLVFTKSIRATSRPLWRESFQSVPLGRYAQHVISRERNEYGDANYRPSRLLFSVYDDDAVPVQGMPRESDRVWKRCTPHRGTLLGTASVNIGTLFRNVNGHEFEVELPIRLHSRRNATRNNPVLTVRMKTTAGTHFHDYTYCNRGFRPSRYYL